MNQYDFIQQIKGAFLKEEIDSFGGGFDDFLQDLMTIANKYHITFKENFSKEIFHKHFAEHKNRVLTYKEEIFLSKLFQRKILEHPKLFRQLYPSMKKQIMEKSEEELKNDEILMQFGFAGKIRKEIAKFLKNISDRVDAKILEKYHVFFDKLLNAFLMKNFVIFSQNENWQHKIKEFGEIWGFDAKVIETIGSGKKVIEKQINFQSACPDKLENIQHEILDDEKSQWPYCLLVKIIMSHEIGGTKIDEFVATGFFVDDKTIMTALHVFYDGENQRIDNREFSIIYYDGKNEPLGKILPKSTFFHFPETINDKINDKDDIDIAILSVKRDGGRILKEKKGNGFFTPKILTKNDLKTTCYLAGFWPKKELEKSGSFDKNWKNNANPKEIGMFSDSGHIIEIKEEATCLFIHTVTAYCGQSGSPIYKIEHNKLILWGVHHQIIIDKAKEYHMKEVSGLTTTKNE